MLAARLLAGLLTAVSVTAGLANPLDEVSLPDLENRLNVIDSEVAELASFSLRGGVGNVGYRSRTHEQAESQEWVQIDLGREELIDQIVLVPMIWRDTRTGFRAEGFPLEFRILAGTEKDGEESLIASFSTKDELLPRIAPLVVDCPGTKASRVRIEASVLSPRAWDGRYLLQLSEIFVFRGAENLALHKPVTTSSHGRYDGAARHQQFLVDGSVPYLMDAAQGEQSIAFLSQAGAAVEPTLSIDLGAIHQLNRIHLHALDLSDTVPPSHPPDTGVPRLLRIEGGESADFSDAVLLTEFEADSVYQVAPIMMRSFAQTPCRYVRFVATDPFINQVDTRAGTQIGFAEIELFSRGRNVALGAAPSGNFVSDSPERSFAALTDGLNLYGQILPLRKWMNELAFRHELEAERPTIVAELDKRHVRQKKNLMLMGWLVALLAVGIVFSILLNRLSRMRHVARIRQRLAADLHDELGANLHTIGLLSDLAADADPGTKDLSELHRRIRSETERSGAAVRHCTNMLEGGELDETLREDMGRLSRRVMSQLDTEILIEGEEFLKLLKPRTRYDLFLFYKESLVNVSRHSEATGVTTHLKADGRMLELTVTDNGCGITNFGEEDPVPRSLRRRANLLGGKVAIEESSGGGTCVRLNVKTRAWGIPIR